MVKLTPVPKAHQAQKLAREVAAETIQSAYRHYRACKPAIKLKRINSEEKLVQDIAADIIKGGLKRSNSIKKNRIPGTPPLGKYSAPSPRSKAMMGTEVDGRVSWLEIKKITCKNLKAVSWDGKLDAYVKINGFANTGVLWSTKVGPWTWSKLDSVVPISTSRNELEATVYDANRLRDDVLIGECLIDMSPALHGPETVMLSANLLNSKQKSVGTIEIHALRSSGLKFPDLENSSIKADHRKISIDELAISSDVKDVRDVRDEAKALAEKKPEKPNIAPRKVSRVEPRTERKEKEPATVPSRREAQPRKEANAALHVAKEPEAKVSVPKQTIPDLPKELKKSHVRRRRVKSRSQSPSWLEKNTVSDKRLLIDEAYDESFKKLVQKGGFYLTIPEIALILQALGHDEAVAPSVTEFSPGGNNEHTYFFENQSYIKKGVVHISIPSWDKTEDLAGLFTEMAHSIDFGIYGTHNNVPAQTEEKEEKDLSATSTETSYFKMTGSEAKVIKEHLVLLVTGTWSRIRNFILLVCAAHPEQGGGRPSNWSVSWIQKFARKLDFPEERFMSCNGLQFLEENRNDVKFTFGIVPSLLQLRFGLYQHILRLIESWWTIPSRPSDRFINQPIPKAVQTFVPFALPQKISKLVKKTISAPDQSTPKKSGSKNDYLRGVLSPTYVLHEKGYSDKLRPGNTVIIGPRLILYPGLLEAAKENNLDTRDHLLEKYAELVGGRSGVVAVLPYGRHDYSGMLWIQLQIEPDEKQSDLHELANDLAKVDVTDILVSGKHVLIPEVCLMNTYGDTKAHRRTVDDRIGYDNHYGKSLDEWRDDYSDDGQPAYTYGGDEDYPPSPETYIGGGKGVERAVVTAPLPDVLPERKHRPASAIHTRRSRRDESPSAEYKPKTHMITPALEESLLRPGGWETIWSTGGGPRGGSPESTLKHRSIDDYPSPDSYIGGGKGVPHAVVTAPLPNPIPNPDHHEKLPGSPPRDRSSSRLLYRPLPNLYDTIMPDEGDYEEDRSHYYSSLSREKPLKTRSNFGNHFEDAEAVLISLAGGVTAAEMKDSVKTSVDRFNQLDKGLRRNSKPETKLETNKSRARRHSFDPLKQNVSERPRPQTSKDSKKRKKKEDGMLSRDDSLKQLIETLENINDVNELQAIQDGLAGNYRAKSARSMGSPVDDLPGLHPDGIIESMIKYKLNHDGDSNSANLKMKKWGLSPRRPKSAVVGARSTSSNRDSDAENHGNNSKSDASGNEEKTRDDESKTKYLFPWMIGQPRVSDDIDPRRNERLWRALKVAEKESAKKGAHLKRELKKMGASDTTVNDPYDTYTNV